MQNWQFPIHNGTLETLISNSYLIRQSIKGTIVNPVFPSLQLRLFALIWYSCISRYFEQFENRTPNSRLLCAPWSLKRPGWEYWSQSLSSGFSVASFLFLLHSSLNTFIMAGRLIFLPPFDQHYRPMISLT